MTTEKTEQNVLGPFDLTSEAWREYDFDGRTYRIERPQALYYRPAGSTHRILDSNGVVHCIPFGKGTGSVLRWENFDKSKPVNF